MSADSWNTSDPFGEFSLKPQKNMKLDRNQEKAVNHGTGPAIVIAGPGSGKTTVVTARILNLIQTHNIPPSQILAIAFNRKAVEEMETRILHELASSEFSDNTETSQKPVIRTLHAFGKDIITENYKRAGFNQIPEIWAGQVDAIIAQERTQIERDAANASVAIYKIESKKTGRCYIGQTLNPNRRRKEHFEHSSNDRLRQAIRSEGESHFSFEVLEQVPGREANRREAHWIKFYKDRSVLHFVQGIEKVSKKITILMELSTKLNPW
jgi:superfamily I DNA/RNA helicase